MSSIIFDDTTTASIALPKPCPRHGCRELRAFAWRLLRIEIVLWLALASEWFGPWARRHLLPMLGG